MVPFKHILYQSYTRKENTKKNVCKGCLSIANDTFTFLYRFKRKYRGLEYETVEAFAGWK